MWYAIESANNLAGGDARPSFFGAWRDGGVLERNSIPIVSKSG